MLLYSLASHEIHHVHARSSNVSAAVNEEAEKGLRLDARLSNNERPRTINSRPFTYGISTANPTNAPIVDAAPRPIPSKRIRSRLQHAATKTLPKRSDSVVVENPGGHERGFCAGQRMSGSLPTAGASSVRDQDVTRPSGRLSNPLGAASQQKRFFKHSRLSDRMGIGLSASILGFVCAASVVPQTYRK
ncbi:hypothetical protein P692DRAFT_20881624 [Suillus brevipes Sb2]|nr:hypothetical protein P692DRAFT_20881624 [Suillus brevipes Sb2]